MKLVLNFSDHVTTKNMTGNLNSTVTWMTQQFRSISYFKTPKNQASNENQVPIIKWMRTNYLYRVKWNYSNTLNWVYARKSQWIICQ